MKAETALPTLFLLGLRHREELSLARSRRGRRGGLGGPHRPAAGSRAPTPAFGEGDRGCTGEVVSRRMLPFLISPRFCEEKGKR